MNKYIVKHTFMGIIVFNTHTGMMHSAWQGASARVKANEVARTLNANEKLRKFLLKNERKAG